MNSVIQWEGQFYEALRHLTYARQLIEENAGSDSKNVIGEIYRTLLETAEICGNLKYYFCRNSIDKWITGEELSKEDFYLLAAQGVLVIPSESGLHEAHEEFAYYLYQDNTRKGYINPSQSPKPQPNMARITVGVTPEDVRICCLKPDQREFFKTHRPDLFARFRSN